MLALQSKIKLRHIGAVVGSAALVFGLASLGVFSALRNHALPQTEVLGAVLSSDADIRRQMPIPNTVVTATIGSYQAQTKSDTSGFFKLTIPTLVRFGRTVTIQFSHPGYHDSARKLADPSSLLIEHLDPIIESASHHRRAGAVTSITNVRIRYTVKTESFIDVGIVVKPFEVRNIGNTACHNHPPCSPDGVWKASTGSLTIDAHEGNFFRNARVSCIAGPCPFTRIEAEDLRDNARLFVATAIDWSDSATFLVEADVVHAQRSDLVRQGYPVIFGNGMSFTLPPGSASASIVAEVNRDEIVFPLGPDLILSWADCTTKTDPDQSRAIACEVKPGYRFD